MTQLSTCEVHASKANYETFQSYIDVMGTDSENMLGGVESGEVIDKMRGIMEAAKEK
jgi:hypothetical protein